MNFETAAKALSTKKPPFHKKNTGNLTQHEKLKEEIDKHLTKQVDNIKLREQWLNAQKRKNYIHEYERLFGAVQSGVVKNPITVKMLNKRMGRLKELASQSIHDNDHQIYSEKRFNEKSDREKFADVNKKLRSRKPNRTHNTLILSQAGATTEVQTG